MNLFLPIVTLLIALLLGFTLGLNAGDEYTGSLDTIHAYCFDGMRGDYDFTRPGCQVLKERIMNEASQ